MYFGTQTVSFAQTLSDQVLRPSVPKTTLRVSARALAHEKAGGLLINGHVYSTVDTRGLM